MKKDFRQAIFVFGSLCFSIVASTILHESGHALATLLTGGKISSLVINPLGWSYVVYESSILPQPLFTAWGGILFSTIASIILLWIALQFQNPYWVFIGFVGIFILLSNGMNFMMGLIYSTGDPALLYEYGVPIWIILLVGCLSAFGGVLLAILFQPFIGITPGDSFLRRLFILGSGIIFYRLLVTIYATTLNPDNLQFWINNFGLNIIFIFIFVILATIARNSPFHKSIQPLQIDWRHGIFALFMGFISIIIVCVV
jgi:hypothetical protein